MLIRTFKYRIYPTKQQETLLNQTIEECRWLYNHLLETRISSWKEDKKTLTYYDQCKYVAQLKIDRPSLSVVYSHTLQDVAMRLDLAFKSFFHRLRTGQKSGYPRFKGVGRYNSISFPQACWGCKVKDNKLVVSKVGHIKIKSYKVVVDKLKISRIKRTSTGKWYVFFIQETKTNHLPKTNKSVGIDVGLKTFATLSDGTEIQNPRFFKDEEKNLAKAQRKLSKAEKGPNDRNKRRKVVARIHERITNKCTNFSHQTSRQIINNYDIICVEDLNINRMQQDNFKCINKSINDVAWGQFFNFISYKAAEAGREFVKVNPAYTSQDCYRCGHRQKMQLSQRTYSCPCCGLELDRDHNAALNILRLGTQSLKQPLRKALTAK
jgi:putative transposase